MNTKVAIRSLVVFTIFYLALFLLGKLLELTLDAEKFSSAFVIFATVAFAVINHFLDSKAKAWLDERLDSFIAFFMNAPFVYNILVYVQIPGEIATDTVQTLVEKQLSDNHKKFTYQGGGGNHIILSIESPATTLSITVSVSPEEDEYDFDYDSQRNQMQTMVRITSLDPILVGYRDRQIMNQYTALVNSIASKMQSTFDNNNNKVEPPQLHVIVNRLINGSSPRHPKPPINTIAEPSLNDAVVYRDRRALQVNTRDLAALQRELGHDVSSLEPIA
jgi:hypothetical protein